MVGKKAARAAPIRAFAPRSLYSAARISGRRTSRSDGNPPGRVVGIATSVSVTASFSRRDSSGVSGWPNSNSSALRSRANCRVYAARLISAERSAISAIRRSSCVALPVRASWVVNVYELFARPAYLRLSAAAPGQPVASARRWRLRKPGSFAPQCTSHQAPYRRLMPGR